MNARDKNKFSKQKFKFRRKNQKIWAGIDGNLDTEMSTKKAIGRNYSANGGQLKK